MNYIPKNKVFHYWRIKIVPDNTEGYGSVHCPVFKGKTPEGALKAAERYTRGCHVEVGGKSIRVYGVAKENPIEYECDAWGRRIANV